MDITVYLPDEIGKRAKKAGLNLSGLLRTAVTEELEMIEARAETLNDPRTFDVGLEDEEGHFYIGRVTGALIAQDGDTQVFLTEDERVLLYDYDNSKCRPIDDPESALRDALGDGAYFEAMIALGETPVIDL